MEIENRKLELIQWLIELEDNSILDKIEDLKEQTRAPEDIKTDIIEKGLKKLHHGQGFEHGYQLNDLKG
ncbi:MAG: hypothetical protein R3281_07005 [Balneolaceae bacterium]|nr:hypothetical protein [Balneolaceae bacterium]